MSLRPYQLDAAEALLAGIPVCNPLCVAPTGSGKSHIIAHVATTVRPWRTLILQHRSELVEQNAEKVAAIIGREDVGIYASKLDRYEHWKPVCCAMIQSVWRKPEIFKKFQLVIVDECHLIPTEAEKSDGMYTSFLRGLPDARVCGLTATPHRLSGGPIAKPGNMLDKVVYDIDVASLVSDGFLCPLRGKHSKATVDMTGVHHRGGEFVQPEMAAKFEECKAVDRGVADMLRQTHDRHSVLIFSSSVKHGEMLLERINGSRLITGKTPTDERKKTIGDFRERRFKYLINVDVLTTGFDAPCVDAIAIMRATESAALYAQMVGRAMRVYAEKPDSLVLDYGGNIIRHGAIDNMVWPDVDSPEPKSKQPAVRVCPLCDEVTSNKPVCPCGYIFPTKPRNSHERLNLSASDEAPMLLGGEDSRLPVLRMVINAHTRNGKAPCLKVQYVTLGKGVFTNFLFPSFDPMKPWATKTFSAWWRAHCVLPGYAIPSHAMGAVEAVHALKCPSHIAVLEKQGKPFPKILTYFSDAVTGTVVAGSTTHQVVRDDSHPLAVETPTTTKPKSIADAELSYFFG